MNLAEMKLNGRDNLCCGGGGGRMFTEVEEERKAFGHARGPGNWKRVRRSSRRPARGVTLCWENAVRDLKVEDKIKVMDVAEILAQALGLVRIAAP